MNPADNLILPYLTADLPGIGGKIKVKVDDFQVEEIPAYPLSGEGQHLFLLVEKRDLPHDLLLRRVAQFLQVSPNDIGAAGIKDRRAITRQYLSVPAKAAAAIQNWDHPDFQIVESKLHGNKLRTGHLKGNRFTILVREPAADAAARASQIIDRIRAAGLPNFYGEQRFGNSGQTLQLGIDLLSGRSSPRDIPFAKRKFLLRLALSSVQSELFNRVLAARILNRTFDKALQGDVMEVCESGGKFIVEDPGREQPRVDARETVVTGPMFGIKMKAPADAAAAVEQEILDQSGLKLADFSQYAQLLSGTRRALMVHPQEINWAETPDGIQFTFSLPPGSYATMLLRELMKVENPTSDQLAATSESPENDADE